MKTVILAGGLGTRLAEETDVRPKPMVEIGGRPILWHIMKTYSAYGLNDFIICLGYKSYVIKEYFANYFLHQSDVTFDLGSNKMEFHHNKIEPWKVTLVDTGSSTMTGGRIKKVQSYIGNEDFCMTYGDGVGNINIKNLIEFHKSKKVLATVTATRQPARFGALGIKEGRVDYFEEKPLGNDGWINGGFFVLSPKVFSYIKDDDSIWEREPMDKLVQEKQLSAFQHDGFWQPMDTLREKHYLEKLWSEGEAPWKVW